MALFQDFTFSPSSEQHAEERYIDPSDSSDVSPRSSRSTSPFSASPSILSQSSSYMDPVHPISPFPSLELSPSLAPTSSFPLSRCGPAPERQRRHAQDFFSTVRSRRQSAVRLQCDPKRAASIRNYVERFLSDYESASSSPTSSRHPSSVESHIPPPTSAPAEDASTMHMIKLESEDDDEAEALQGLSLDDDVPGGNGARRISADALGLANGRRRNYAVQKKVKGGRQKAGGRF